MSAVAVTSTEIKLALAEKHHKGFKPYLESNQEK